ncbi:MAG: glutamate ligase domain-containing protein, partial [Sphingomonas sp.]
PDDVAIWLDGGHNPAAATAVAETLRRVAPEGDRHLILGMLANKDPEGLLAPLAPLLASVTAVPVPGHEHHAPADLASIAQRLGIRSTMTASDIPEALGWVRRRIDPRGEAPVVLILGSLYLAGTVLEANDELPD